MHLHIFGPSMIADFRLCSTYKFRSYSDLRKWRRYLAYLDHQKASQRIETEYEIEFELPSHLKPAPSVPRQ